MSLMLADILRIKEERGYSVAKLSEYSGVPIGTLQKRSEEHTSELQSQR